MRIREPFSRPSCAENVGRGLELQRERLGAALQLGGVCRSRAIVGNGGGHDHDVGFGSAVQNGRAHFFGGVHRHPVDAFGHAQIGGSADQNHFRSAAHGGFGDGVAHFAGRAIGEESHGIERFARGAGGDENRFAGEVAAQAENFKNFLRDGFCGGEASRADHAAGQIAFVGIDYVDAARAQRGQIGLRGGMLPHVHVHGGRNDNGRLRGEIERAEKILGDAVREFTERVRSGGGYQKQVDALRHGNVLDGAFHVGGAGFLRAEHFGDDFLAGDCGEGEGSDEFGGGAGHHDLHVELFLLQAAHEFRRFISCDSAGDANGNFHGLLGEKAFAGPPRASERMLNLRGPAALGINLRNSMPEQPSRTRLLAPALFFLFADLRKFVLEHAAEQFFLGDAGGLARPWVIHQRTAADHQLPRAPRHHDHIRELAIRRISQNGHVQISLQTTSEFREPVLPGTPPCSAN